MKMRKVDGGPVTGPWLAVIRMRNDNLNLEINGLSGKALSPCHSQWPFQIDGWLHFTSAGPRRPTRPPSLVYPLLSLSKEMRWDRESHADTGQESPEIKTDIANAGEAIKGQIGHVVSLSEALRLFSGRLVNSWLIAGRNVPDINHLWLNMSPLTCL